MHPPALTARTRALWEGLAGAPAAFSPAVRVAVSPQSRMCPSGWLGIVVIGEEAIATAPAPGVAQIVQQALGALPAAALTDAGVLSARLPVAEIRGPASLAYLDAGEFRPQRGAALEQAGPQDAGLRSFLSECDAADVAEGGIEDITSPAFAVRERGNVIAVAGYRAWPGRVAHVCVLTGPRARGRGLARITGSAAVAHAIRQGMLPQWRARLATSQRIARDLGFRELGSQACIRLHPADGVSDLTAG